MKKIILLLIIPFISYSQNIHYGNNSESIKICTALQIKSFSSNKAAESALDKILGAIEAIEALDPSVPPTITPHPKE